MSPASWKMPLIGQPLGRGGEKGGQNQQDGESPNVEDALHRPDRQLGGKGQVLAARNQIGADEFPGAAQQRQTRKSNDGGRNQLPG